MPLSTTTRFFHSSSISIMYCTNMMLFRAVGKGIPKHFIIIGLFISPKSMPAVSIVPTKLFSVYDWEGVKTHRKIFDYSLKGSFDSQSCQKFTNVISKHGFCVIQDLVPEEIFNKVAKSIRRFAKDLFNHYDQLEDEFADYDKEEHNVVRMPRIGKGKHNIHFDPEFSEQHQLVRQLVEESHILELLSHYMKKTASLRESGLSVTKPKFSSEGSGVLTEPGDGMEWHSDGARGEATMLLAISNVPYEMGSLRIVPRSHFRYVDGIGHDEKIIEQDMELLELEKVNYAYHAGKPIIFDARTLHSVDCNSTDDWRVVIWFIIDSY